MENFWYSKDALYQPWSPVCEPLNADIKTELTIVGGGFAGLSIANYIKRYSPQTEVTLLEAEKCGSGASSKSGGMITPMLYAIPWLFTGSLPQRKTLEATRLMNERMQYTLAWLLKNGLQTCKQSSGAPETCLQVCKVQKGVPADTLQTCKVQKGVPADTFQVCKVQKGAPERCLQVCKGFLGYMPVHSELFLSAQSQLGLGAIQWLEKQFLLSNTSFQPCSGEFITEKTGEMSKGGFSIQALSVQPALLIEELKKNALAKGVKIYENSKVDTINSHKKEAVEIFSNGFKIETSKVVIASGAWTECENGFRGNKTTRVVMTFSVATEKLSRQEVEQLGGDKTLVGTIVKGMCYRRLFNDHLVFGALDVPLSRPDDYRYLTESTRNKIEALMHKSIPQLKKKSIRYFWGGPLQSTSWETPIIQHWKNNNRIILASGFSGVGLCWTLNAGWLTAGLVNKTLETDEAILIRNALSNYKVPYSELIFAGFNILSKVLNIKRG